MAGWVAGWVGEWVGGWVGGSPSLHQILLRGRESIHIWFCLLVVSSIEKFRQDCTYTHGRLLQYWY